MVTHLTTEIGYFINFLNALKHTVANVKVHVMCEADMFDLILMYKYKSSTYQFIQQSKQLDRNLRLYTCIYYQQSKMFH